MKTKKEALFLRVEPDLNKKLKGLSEQANQSLNEYCISALESSIGDGIEFDEFKQITTKAKKLFKDSLKAIIVFGSYARGDNTSESDIDVLLVLDCKINRELYSRWDMEEDQVSNLSIHFSALPKQSLSGFWCEIALEGVTIFDKDLSVSRFLIALRNKILSGEFVARYSHGHRYWSLAA